MNARHRAGDEEPVTEPMVSGAEAEPKRRSRLRRRVTTQPVAGSDPHPTPEPKRHVAGENDDQLKRDVPPHWGSD